MRSGLHSQLKLQNQKKSTLLKMHTKVLLAIETWHGGIIMVSADNSANHVAVLAVKEETEAEAVVVEA